jgi:MFS family permease
VVSDADAKPLVLADVTRSGPRAAQADTETETETEAAPRKTGIAASLAPLRRRNFCLMWTGGLISVIGSWMQTVAVGALVISRTGEATWAVAVAAASFLPLGVLAPFGGVLADKLPRRAVLVLGNLVAGLVAAAIAIAVWSGRDTPELLVALVAVQGCVAGLTGPFLQAILPDLVPRSEFLAAASLNSAQFNLGRVAGPALAGITIAAFGYAEAFVANAISFLAVVVALAFVRVGAPAGREEEEKASVWKSLRVGIDAARRTPACAAAIGTITVVAFFGSPFIALVPAMARHVSGGGGHGVASATALLTTAQGVGAVCGALAMAPLAGRYGRPRVLAAGLSLFPVSLVLYGPAGSLAWATATLFVVGFCYIFVLSGLGTVVQLHAPSAQRGRVLSFYLVGLGVTYSIGALVQGPIVDRLGIAWTTCGGAALLAVVLAIISGVRPDLRRALLSEPPDAV